MPRSRWRPKSPPRSPQPQGNSHENSAIYAPRYLRADRAPGPRNDPQVRQSRQSQPEMRRRQLHVGGGAPRPTCGRRQDAMTAGTARTSQRSLPQLSGRLLWFYRIAWCALAIGAVVASSELLLQAEPIAAIVGLRLVKSAVLICAATILLYRRQRDPVAALLALAFLTWTISSSFDFWTGAALPQLLDRCRFLLFALALLLFPDGRMQPGWIRPAMAASFVVFLIGVVEAL